MQTLAKSAAKLDLVKSAVYMAAAAMHEQLMRRGGVGWYKEFQQRVAAMCEQCDVKASSVKVYVTAGKLMLRSKVLAFSQPAFVNKHKNGIALLVAKEGTVARWDAEFDRVRPEDNVVYNLLPRFEAHEGDGLNELFLGAE